jgi:hypothetical protein
MIAHTVIASPATTALASPATADASRQAPITAQTAVIALSGRLSCLSSRRCAATHAGLTSYRSGGTGRFGRGPGSV